MKRLLFIFLFFISIFSYSQNIVNVIQDTNGRISVKYKNGTTRYEYSKGIICGFSKVIIVSKFPNGRVVIYDQDFHRISDRYISNIKSISVNYDEIVVNYNNGRVGIYNKKFEEISSYYN